jgi:hypothetical protein
LWQTGLLYTVRIAKKPPFANRALRSVGNATHARKIGSTAAVAPGRNAGRYGS